MSIKTTIAFFVVFVVQLSAVAEEPWIIDTHTHFKGKVQVAYEKNVRNFEPQNTLGHVVVPSDYAPIAKRLKIRSTVVVEAVEQDKHEYNDWLFQQAKSDLISGYVARSDLAADDFITHHDRYRSTGLLKGYRFRRDELGGYLKNAKARENIALLQEQDLVVDLLIDPEFIRDVEKLARDFPRLRIVINHCFRARMKNGELPKEWYDAVNRAAIYPNVHCKFSSLIDFAGGKPFGPPAPKDLNHYLPVFEACYQAFGQDRLIFGTNWGVCSHFGPVDEVVRLAKKYLSGKGEGVLRKVMRDNAIGVYQLAESDVD